MVVGSMKMGKIRKGDGCRGRGSDEINGEQGARVRRSANERGAIHDMVASDGDDMGSPRNQVIDSLYVECDQPSEDPNMTCAHAASLLLYLGSSPFFFLTRF